MRFPKNWLMVSWLLMMGISGAYTALWAQTIVQGEYFFDKDPGVGLGIPLPLTPGATVKIATEIPTTGLLVGPHNLFIRFKDSEGRWGLPEERLLFVYVDEQSQSLPAITQGEYFFDKDPGVGLGNKLPLTLGQTLNLATDIPTTGLPVGPHNLFVRFKDSEGKWGLAEERLLFVYVDQQGQNSATLTYAEYFFDETNPPPGKATPLSFTSASAIELLEKIDIKGLSEGNHRLTLRIQDNQGRWSAPEIQEFTVATPRIDTITPASGGNVGDVTVNILGASFDEGTKVKLVSNGKPDIVVPDTLMSIFNGEQIQAQLDLRGKAIGEYNVVATLSNGTELTIPNGFTVLEGVKAEPWVEIIGFNRIRRGQWQTYTITYGNRGNVDATGVPLWIQVPVESEFKLDFELYKPESDTIILDTIPDYILTDTIHGKPEKAKLIPMVIPYMAPGKIGTLTFKVKTTSAENFKISAWVSRSMYQSPLNPNVVDCYANIAAAVANLIPGVGCAYGILDLGLRPLLKLGLTGDNGLNDSQGKPKAGSLVASVAFATAACIPGALLLGNVGKIVGGIAKVGTIKSGSDAVTGCEDSFVPEKPKEDKEIQPVNSFDPNDKLGLEGAGSKKYIKGNEVFPYLIRFENKASATAAAQTVLIIDTLDKAKLDLSSLELGFMSFNDRIVDVPPGRKNYTAYVDLRPSQDLTVKIEAKLDESTGVLTWLYTSLDPSTRKLTENPDAGFLPPNKTAPEGEGGVFFTIRPIDSLATNDDIKNKAYIYFDNNEVIPTPVWSNAIDKLAPVSQVASLPQAQADSTFNVSWSGSDEGAGIRNYSIYVSVNNKPYKLWLNRTTDTSSLFEGKPDSTYQFYSIAQDSTGILEAAPATADAITTIAKVTGLEDDLARQVKVYPNPVVHTLMVELPEQLRNATLTIINAQGGVVSSLQSKNSMELSLKVSQFAKGLYLLRISDGRSTVVKKVIIE